MGLFNGIKRLFGFDSDDYIEEENEDGEILTTSTTAAATAAEQDVRNQEIKPDMDNLVIPDAALERLVNLLNANMPEYVRSCVDKSAQKKYICEAMGDSFKNFTEEIKAKVVASENAAWSSYKKNSEDQIKKNNATIEEQKSKIEEIKSQLLSSERQRRALKESIKDMEDKVAKAESEVEQCNLEIKSLMNKLKVEQVKTGDSEHYRNENTRLMGEINKLKADAFKAAAGLKNEGDAEKQAELEKEIDRLNGKIAEIEAEKTTLVTEKTALEAEVQAAVQAKEDILSVNDSLLAQNRAAVEEFEKAVSAKDREISEKTALLAKHELSVSDLKSELAMTVKMVEEFRTKAAKALAETERVKAASEQSGVDETAVAELREKLKLANEEIEALREQVEEAGENSEILEQIEAEFEKLEKARQDDRDKIQTLTQSVKNKEVENLSLRNEVSVLTDSIAEKDKQYSLKIKEISGMYEAKIEEMHKKEIEEQQPHSIDVDDLEDTLADVFAPIELEKKPAEKTGLARESIVTPVVEVDLDNIDLEEELESDWLQPTPPTPPVVKPKPEPEEPKSDSRREDDSLQMSLF